MAEQITHEGIVREEHEGMVHVEIVQQAACAGCKAKSMCTASETMVKMVDAWAVEPLQVGDKVLVSVSKKLGWKAVLLAFVIPLCILLLAVWALPYFIASEALVGTIALCLLAPYYLVLHLFSDKMKQEYQFTASKLAE